MKLRDFEYNPLGIINKYPFYPELMGKHIKTKPNEKRRKTDNGLYRGKNAKDF